MDLVFSDRGQAGEELAKALLQLKLENPVVLAIPRGGVPVGVPVSKALNAPFFVLVARKLPVPWSPEVGFGAIAPDGSKEYNPELLSQMSLPKGEIEKIEDKVLQEIRRRIQVYCAGKALPSLKGKTALVVDDGLATGYTMVAACKYAKNLGAKKVVAAVPTSSASAFELVKNCVVVNEVVSLVVSHALSYAVAASYNDFHDMKDEEVLKQIKEADIQ